MKNEEAKEILRHWNDAVWLQENHITMGQVSDALYLAEEALDEPVIDYNGLTWQDMKKVSDIIFDTIHTAMSVKNDEEFYTEVLRKFKDYGKEENNY